MKSMNKRKPFAPGSPLAVLFHKAWGQAKTSPDYDKRVWLKLDNALAKLLEQEIDLEG